MQHPLLIPKNLDGQDRVPTLKGPLGQKPGGKSRRVFQFVDSEV